MAAAEYYSNMPMTGSQQQLPYQQPHHSQAYPQPHSQPSYPPSQAPPPYQAVQSNASNSSPRPSVHFADGPPRPQQPHRNSFSSQAPIPVAVEHQHESAPAHRPSPQLRPAASPAPNQYPPQQAHRPSPQLKPAQPQSADVKTHLHPDTAHQIPYRPSHSRPYLNGNQSQYSLSGYSSDPEPHRRRRRRHSHESRGDGSDGRNRRDDRTSSSREIRDSDRNTKPRSRSTNADAFLGATGGGLIGDLIFPGLGTVGGVVAGWLGGKDYAKHRKHREDRRDREQESWERKHRTGSHEGRDEYRHRRHGDSHDRRGDGHDRRKYDY